MEIVDVPQAATEALELFGKNTYQNTAFKFIDFLSPVLDTQLAKILVEELVKAIREASDEFEVAIPDILPSSLGTFRFERASERGRAIFTLIFLLIFIVRSLGMTFRP